jgi:hypothetical protein
LRRTKEAFLVFGDEEELIVMGYTNACFQTDTDDYKSQFDFVFFLNGGTVSWKSSKKDNVENSMIEVEYIVASKAGKEVVWIINFVF